MDSDEISISKSIIPDLPNGYEETCLGSPRRAVKQYRHKSGIHAREYGGYFTVHQDRFDPRTKPLLHLVLDSPEAIVAFGSATVLSKALGKSKAGTFSSTPFGFLVMFLSLSRFFRTLKHLICD